MLQGINWLLFVMKRKMNKKLNNTEVFWVIMMSLKTTCPSISYWNTTGYAPLY
jgi:hypothetical protein